MYDLDFWYYNTLAIAIVIYIDSLDYLHLVLNACASSLLI